MFRMMRVGLIGFAVLLLASVSYAAGVEKPFNQLQMRMKKATVELTYKSKAEAEAGKLIITPLPDNKQWAFTTRWDDNNSRHRQMHEVMTKHGIKGGFYLNSDWGRDDQVKLAQDLAKDGCSIGLHSMTHPMLTILNNNEIFWEIIACKVERESDIDKPIVCFGFAFCNFRNPVYPKVQQQVAESFIRAGIHHVVNPAFVDEKMGIYPETFSVSRFMVPGDVNPLPEKFDKLIERVVSVQKYQQQNPIITLAFHTRHTDEGFANLGKSFEKHGNHDDWWYCEPNEYAAYRYRFHNTKIARKSVKDNVATYELITSVDGDAGRSVPLTIDSSGKPDKVQVNGKSVAGKQTPDGYLFKVFSEPDGTMPEKIDTVANPDNSVFSDQTQSRFDKFKNILFHLSYDATQKTAVLTASNQSSTQISNIHAVLRLPSVFNVGIVPVKFADLAPKATVSEKISLSEQSDDVAQRDGVPYLVAQVDFTHDNHVGRMYATCREKPEADFVSCPRDAALVLGPFAQATTERLIGMSDPGQALTKTAKPYSPDAWWPVPEKRRLSSKADCVMVLFPRSQRPVLQKLVDANETGNIALAFSFIPPKGAEKVTLTWPGWGGGKDNKIKDIFLNGKRYPATLRELPVKPGQPNRLIVVPNVTADRLMKVQLRLPGISLSPKVDWQQP